MGRLRKLAKTLGAAMPAVAKTLGAAMPTVLVLIGAAATAVGVGMIYLPAGVIAGGVLSALAGYALIKGGGDDT